MISLAPRRHPKNAVSRAGRSACSQKGSREPSGRYASWTRAATDARPASSRSSRRARARRGLAAADTGMALPAQARLQFLEILLSTVGETDEVVPLQVRLVHVHPAVLGLANDVEDLVNRLNVHPRLVHQVESVGLARRRLRQLGQDLPAHQGRRLVHEGVYRIGL